MTLRLADDQQQAQPLPDCAPRTLARAFIEHFYTDGDRRRLRHWRDTFYAFENSVYVPLVREDLRSNLSGFLEEQRYLDGDKPVPFMPSDRKVRDVLVGLADICQAIGIRDMPSWLDKNRPAPDRIIAFRNGLLNIDEYIAGSVRLLPPTAMWFSANVLPFDFRPESPEPKAWWDFLLSIWGDDVESIELLREWFGYVMTTSTLLQKILLLVGPTRSGKGTINRILRALVGGENYSAPTLAGLASGFGMWGLMGKQLAVISDARLSGRSDQAVVIERLLTLSGEDAVEIHRKNLEPVTVKLPTRLMVISNELPRLTDASGALADRFVTLTLTKSFLGREDVDLTGKLQKELPSICLWALEGLKRLMIAKRFTVPESSREAVDELHDLSSPMKAFVRDCCDVREGRQVLPGTLYDAWKEWCRTQGIERPGTQQTFGRDLRAAVPELRVKQLNDKGERTRVYEGIGIG